MSHCLFATAAILITLKLLFISSRLVFDILGGMWLSSAMNSFDIIITFIAIYGLVSGRLWPFIILLPWCFLWISWNIAIFLMYQDIINFSLFHSMLTLGLPDSFSWWYSHGFRCSIPDFLHLISDEELTEDSLRNRENLASLFGFQSASPGQQVKYPNDYHFFTKTVEKTRNFADLSVWFQSSNQSVQGLCWPDYRLIESAHSCLQIVFTALLLAISIAFIVHLRRTKKLVICRGDFTFVAMPRGGLRSEKVSSVPTGVFGRLEPGLCRPLLADSNERPSNPNVENKTNPLEGGDIFTSGAHFSHQKSNSVTATQSTTSDHINDIEYFNGTQSNSILDTQTTMLNSDTPVSTRHQLCSNRAQHSPVYGSNNSADIWGVKPSASSLHRLNLVHDSPKNAPPFSDSTQVVSLDHCTMSGPLSQGTFESDHFSLSNRTRSRRTPYSSVSSLASHEPGSGSSSKQLAQLHEYSRRIAQITATRTPSGSTSTHCKEERAKTDINSPNPMPHCSPSSSNLLASSTNERFKQLVQTTNSNAIDGLHFHQQSAPVTQLSNSLSNFSK